MGTSTDKMSRSIRDIFQESQDDSMTVGKSVLRFRKIWDTLEQKKEAEKWKSDFFDKFIFYLQLPLTFKERTNYVERCLEVACRFAASFLKSEQQDQPDKPNEHEEEEEGEEEDLPEFMDKLLNWLLDHHEVEGSQARLRICLMVNRLLKLMSEEASINEELFQKIFDNMLLRLKDKVAEIRGQAVTALQRLQDPRDDNCQIMKAFFFHMGCDPSPNVRKTVIKVLAACKKSLFHVLKRTKDADENVRKAAFKYLSEKIHIKSLTIAQRERLLDEGLNDRSEGVRLIVERDLIPAWLRFSDDNVVELLHSLDVENSDGKIAGKMLRVFFKGVPYQEIVDGFKYLDENKLVPFDKLTPDVAIYWTNMTSFLFEEATEKEIGKAAEVLDSILPELTRYCQYLRHFIIELEVKEEDEEVTWMCTAKHLIEMTKVFDLADEVGRANLGKLCKDIMSNSKVTATFMEFVMPVFEKVRTDTESRIQEVAEVIAELRDPMIRDDGANNMNVVEQERGEDDQQEPMEVVQSPNVAQLDDLIRKKKMAIAKIRVQLNELKEDQNNAIDDKDFLKAQEIKVNIEDLEMDQARLDSELVQLTGYTPKQKPAKQEEQVQPTQPSEPASADQEPKVEEPMVTEKCLEMLIQLLKDPAIVKLNPTLRTLLEEFILPNIKHLEPEIRRLGVKAVGLCCLRDPVLAKKQLWLLIQIAHIDNCDVRLDALSMVNDLLLMHGLTAFLLDEEESESNSNRNTMLAMESFSNNIQTGHEVTKHDINADGGGNDLVAFLTKLLDDPDMEIRSKVAEGLCKLLMVGAISSPKLLQRLILVWYNPVAESEGKLRHILGTFFPLYASISRRNQDSLGEAFMPTLKTLFEAPATSPLAEVDIEDVGKFLTELTRRSFLQCKDLEDCTVHDDVVFHLANEIISKPDSFLTKTLVKLLNGLEVTHTDFPRIRDLKMLYDQMVNLIKEKLVLKSLERFGNFLNDCLSRAPDNVNVASVEEEVSGAEKEKNDNTLENSFDSSKSQQVKKRTLFSQSNQTLLTSPHGTPGPSDNIESASSNNEFPSSPGTPVSTGRLNDITRVDETPDEEEEEILVTGNVSGRGKMFQKKNIFKRPKIQIESETSEEEELEEDTRTKKKTIQVEVVENSSESLDEDEMFSLAKPAATSTQKQDEAVDTENGSATTNSTGDDGIVSSFFEKKVGQNARKLRRKQSTTTEEEEEEVVPKKEDEDDRKRRSSRTKSVAASNKKKSTDQTEKSDNESKRKSNVRVFSSELSAASSPARSTRSRSSNSSSSTSKAALLRPERVASLRTRASTSTSSQNSSTEDQAKTRSSGRRRK